MACSGGASFRCEDIDAKSLACNASGGASLTIGGKAGTASLYATGAARINAKKLGCSDVSKSRSGMANINM